ncbi:MAG: paraquat-inducible protein A, partial [Candidatus Aminicenantes bacterium]|nr:paraquat-inducible protein A [Candidatus Aminicenantes bacterium]
FLVKIIQVLDRSRDLKLDLAEINHIRYGLLDPDEWARVIADILPKKIEKFEFSFDNRDALQSSISRVLDQIILEVDGIIRKRNKEGHLFQRLIGGIKQMATDSLIDIQDLRNHLPEFTEIVMKELDSEENRKRLKEYLFESLRSLSKGTSDQPDMTRLNNILSRHDCTDREACRELLKKKISALSLRPAVYFFVLILLGAGLFVLSWTGGMRHFSVWLLIFSCLILLVGGLLTPMIEVEAKISELRFELMGEPVVFENQVLYFRSKSILDVVRILLRAGYLNSFLVGAAILLFSILFPLAKLLTTFFYYYDVRGWKNNRLVKSITLHSGKWSMADVFVVAMLMAYLGFSGIITHQLDILETMGGSTDILTTNGTSLQWGFGLFFAFCIANLFLSSFIQKASAKKNPA